MNWVLAGLLALAAGCHGCSGLKMDGPCTYVRTVTTSYQCVDAGKVEHIRIEPTQQ